MTIDMRAGETDSDVRDAIAPIFHYFGLTAPPDGTVADFAQLMTPARVTLASEQGSPVGGCGSFPLVLTTPGGRVAAAGVSMVGVRPTHRRRGILTGLMTRVFEDCRARNEPVAYLWPSEERIYGRFGYGMTALSCDVRVPRERATLVGADDDRVSVRRASLDEVVGPASGIFAAVAAATPGAFARSSDWWRLKSVADPAWRRHGGGDMQAVVLDIAGAPSAYALYRMNFKVDNGVPTGTVEVMEAVGQSPTATRAIWQFLLSLDWTASITAGFLAADHPLVLMAAEPRRLHLRQRDGAWLRIVDLPTALAARMYGPGALVVDVEDALMSENTGRWRIEGDGARRTTAEPDVRCDIAALASVYLGGFTWRQLVASSRAMAVSEEALARADRVFERRGAPWCPEIF